MGKRGGEPDLPEFILVKKFYPNRRDKQKQMKRIWELRSLAQSGANMTSMDTEDEETSANRRRKKGTWQRLFSAGISDFFQELTLYMLLAQNHSRRKRSPVAPCP